MDEEQAEKWRAAGLSAGFEVISPFMAVLGNGATVKATALLKLGAYKGMVVDPDWSILEPHAEQLLAEGFGFSAVRIDDGEIGELLKDWGHASE